jgi:uncharacterized protein YjiS (DUF1127 family)
MDMAALDTTRTAYGSLSIAGRIGSTLTSMVGSVSTWNDGRLTRQSLNRLSDRELEDIGLVRGDIDQIASGRKSR